MPYKNYSDKLEWEKKKKWKVRGIPERLQRQEKFQQRYPNWQSALSKLNPVEKDTIIGFYGLVGEPQSLQQIAETWGVSRQRIGQIKNIAIAKLEKIE